MRPKTRIKEKLIEPFSNFAPSTDKRYILKHCINYIIVTYV